MSNISKMKKHALMMCTILVLGIICPLIPTPSVKAATTESAQPSRVINVVLDDSTSMDDCINYAGYSLEALFAMMNDTDIMNVYPMSRYSSPTTYPKSGLSKQENINALHNTIKTVGGTYYAAIDKAYRDLQADNSGREKWLVVITDAALKSYENKSMNDLFDLNSKSDTAPDSLIKVAYLSIGSGAVKPTKVNEIIEVFEAQPNKSILVEIKKICKWIFGRSDLKDGTEANGKVELNLPFPASEIIIFAQRVDNDSVGDAYVGEFKNADNASLNVSMKSGSDNISAKIVTITPKPSESYIPDGDYDIDITADEYAVYYKPCLDVAIKLTDKNGKLMTPGEVIPVGDYKLEYFLTYPAGHSDNGKPLSGNPSPVDYTLTQTVGGSTQVLQSNSVHLDECSVKFTVNAKYFDYITSTASIEFSVEDFNVYAIDLELDYHQQEYYLGKLETDNKGITVKVSRNGSPIPSDEWDRFELECSIDNPDFKIVKNKDSTFTIYPRYKDGELSETATGDIEFDIIVSSLKYKGTQNERVTDTGTISASINIFDDVGPTALGVTIDKQTDFPDNLNYPNSRKNPSLDNRRKVTIDWNGKPLTKEQYDALTLTVEIGGEHFEADIILDPYVEGEPTTATVSFTLTPDSEGNLPKAKHIHGTRNFKVDAVIDRLDAVSTGTAEASFVIKRLLTPFEWLILLIIILIIIAYSPIFKRLLPPKSVYQHDHHFQDTIKWYSHGETWLTLLIPFCPICSSHTLISNKGRSVKLKIKGCWRNSVICTNAKEICEAGYYINNMTVTKPVKIYLKTSSITIAPNDRPFITFI